MRRYHGTDETKIHNLGWQPAADNRIALGGVTGRISSGRRGLDLSETYSGQEEKRRRERDHRTKEGRTSGDLRARFGECPPRITNVGACDAETYSKDGVFNVRQKTEHNTSVENRLRSAVVGYDWYRGEIVNFRFTVTVTLV